MKRPLICAAIGGIVGILLSIVGVIFGVFACVPAGPFAERNLEMCISFLVLTVTGCVVLVSAGIGACIGTCCDGGECCDEFRDAWE